MVWIFAANIFNHQGVPYIVSDRDCRMTIVVWQALFDNKGMKGFLSSFYPKIDG